MLRGQHPFEAAIVHNHAWPNYIDGPSEDPDKKTHKDPTNVYHIVIDEKFIHFYNRGHLEILPASGRVRWRRTGVDFKIERSVFKR